MKRIRHLCLLLTLVALAGCGESPTVPLASDWKAPPAAAAKLGDSVKILGGRFSVQAPAGFMAEGDSSSQAFRKGELELGFARITGLPRDAELERYTKTTQDVEGFSEPLKSGAPVMGEIESGTVNGRPFCRFRYTYTNAKKQKLAGFGYVTADRPGTFIYVVARGEPEEVEVLEACVLTFKN